ncbi:hypothetical protein BGW37DRAFT_100625 [Umbelopsis sp. PMI_123]|nr:hypothetical protein BGW37DRAFT_100625 [Umbelopsis sp. PMI_123]
MLTSGVLLVSATSVLATPIPWYNRSIPSSFGSSEVLRSPWRRFHIVFDDYHIFLFAFTSLGCDITPLPRFQIS